MRDIVRVIAEAQSVPEAFVAYPALSHAALAIGNSRKAICYADGGGELPTLWTGILADSGVGKSGVLEKLTSPFEVIEARYAEEYKEDLKRYELELKNNPFAIPPKEKHLLIGDATMEAILAMCVRSPHALLYSESEGRLFFSFDQYRKAKIDEPNYCKLYDNAHIKISRKGSETIAGHGALNIAMMIQPDNFRRALTENVGMTTSGLLARLNLSYPAIGEFRIAERVDNTAYSCWNNAIADVIGMGDINSPIMTRLQRHGSE